ncbi:hypothetical protein ACFV4P_15020 [Kitasatospora sp. NPDC059795]|uniref:hypothetical protein n=1 Tax=Kitasatospora sp. NPDC059795 TaxID=3346949 RepID=UPI00364B968C
MAVASPDLLLLPHCDLHVALTGTPPLTVTLAAREEAVPATNGFTLTPVPPAQCSFEFFAPFNGKGHRFEGLPTYDSATGRITATTPGVFLFQAHTGNQYMVGRLQVHRSVVGWWFGNDSITTALDTAVAHAQPSLYAKFSDDAGTGTDLIGDITGHGYVQLVPADARQLAVSPTGRLRGVLPTQPGTPWVLSGLFPGLGGAQLLNVWVVDYAADHALSWEMGGGDPAALTDRHNVLFLAEGFRDQDRARFDEIVSRAIHELFEKPAHEPYGMLRGSFNAFKSFTASQQHTLTCGYRVAAGTERIEAGQAKGTGFPIPTNSIGGGPRYTLEELVRRVGLPMRGDGRTGLVATWQAQDLDIDPAKIDDDLINAWKQHQSVGILHARDTFFGLRLGGRPADRFSGTGPAAKPDAADAVGDPVVKAFVARVYEFYRTRSSRNLTLDPRRHPPELYMNPSELNPANTLLRYVRSLKITGSTAAVGTVWQPDDQQFQPSRGLIALIANDDMDGGTNFNIRTVTAQTVNAVLGLPYVYANATDKRELRRDPPDIQPNFDEVVHTVSHEFGHSFNLLDEYEEFRGDGGPDEDQPGDLVGDNVSRLGFLRVAAAPDRHIDPAKVKWFQLPRISTAAVLLADSTNVTSPVQGIKLSVGTRNLAEWQQAKTLFSEVRLRSFGIAPGGRQLPLATDAAHYLEGLIVGQVLPGEGAIILTRAGSAPFPTFVKGSIAFVPLKDKQHQPLLVVEPEVLTFLQNNRSPLNQDPDHDNTNPNEDNPVDIPDFSAPCKSARTIGIFEGAATFAGGHYRPSGRCKMRLETDFCHVCAWLIVNRVDPSFHALLDRKFYPESKAERRKHE